MSALPLLVEFSNKGIKVRVDGSELALTAPKGALTPTLVSRVRQEKTALLASLEKIREKAGKDWSEVSENPENLKIFADLLEIEDMRHRGIVPDHYTSTTTCKCCGPVPIWEGCPSEVLGCPWCLNRLTGSPIPKLNLFTNEE